MKEIKENAVYSLEGKKIPNWCFHNILIAKKTDLGEFYLEDTYWSSNSKWFSLKQIEENGWKLKKLFDNFNDLVDVNKAEFRLYDSSDRLYIPVGSWHERFLVLKNAKYSRQKVERYLNFAIEKLENELKWIQQRLIEAKKIKEKFKKGEIHPNAINIGENNCVWVRIEKEE